MKNGEEFEQELFIYTDTKADMYFLKMRISKTILACDGCFDVCDFWNVNSPRNPRSSVGLLELLGPLDSLLRTMI